MHGYIKTPIEVFRIGVGIEVCVRNEYEKYVLLRVRHGLRMNKVWKQLMAEKRGMPGVYLHPAVGGAASAGGPAYAQQRACGELLSFAFLAIRDRVPVSKWSEVEEYRKKVLADTAKYRQVADDLAANGLVDPAADGGAAALLRLAQAKEEESRQILAQTRTRGDPLVIDRDRGDRTVRGVATLIAIKLHELFGDFMYRTAATIAEAGLGEKVEERAVRSMCEKFMKSNGIKDFRSALTKPMKQTSQAD
jgi:hypothetical protein